ncbi:MAG TPA: biopolymer transporter ExbD [Bryobacteraceae bacterium]|nr:biopolymer transporter ExbD [Bryobacteraceae bacterium]
MAFSMGGNGGSGRRSRFRGMNSLAEMNIVPLVDVVMVLLVIFMLTAHVMEFGMEVDVPKVNQVRDTAKELPVITITKEGYLFLNDKEVNINEVGAAVKQRFGNVTGVYVRADKDAIWDVMAQVVSALNQAHMQINVVTQPVDETGKGGGRR